MRPVTALCLCVRVAMSEFKSYPVACAGCCFRCGFQIRDRGLQTFSLLSVIINCPFSFEKIACCLLAMAIVCCPPTVFTDHGKRSSSQSDREAARRQLQRLFERPRFEFISRVTVQHARSQAKLHCLNGCLVSARVNF